MRRLLVAFETIKRAAVLTAIAMVAVGLATVWESSVFASAKEICLIIRDLRSGSLRAIAPTGNFRAVLAPMLAIILLPSWKSAGLLRTDWTP